MPSRSPLVRPSAKAKVREVFTAIFFGCRSSMTCLRMFHCSSPQSSACRSVDRLPAAGADTAFMLRTALNTFPCDVPPSAMRSIPAAPRSKNT